MRFVPLWAVPFLFCVFLFFSNSALRRGREAEMPVGRPHARARTCLRDSCSAPNSLLPRIVCNQLEIPSCRIPSAKDTGQQSDTSIGLLWAKRRGLFGLPISARPDHGSFWIDKECPDERAREQDTCGDNERSDPEPPLN